MFIYKAQLLCNSSNEMGVPTDLWRFLQGCFIQKNTFSDEFLDIVTLVFLHANTFPNRKHTVYWFTKGVSPVAYVC